MHFPTLLRNKKKAKATTKIHLLATCRSPQTPKTLVICAYEIHDVGKVAFLRPHKKLNRLGTAQNLIVTSLT